MKIRLRPLTPLLLLTLAAAQTAPTSRPLTPFDPGSPKAVVEQLSRAMGAGDAAQIRSILLARTPEEKATVDAMVEMSQAIARLRAVTIKRYGAPAARTVTGDPEASLAEAHAKLENAFQSIEGDTAYITFPDPTQDPITLRRLDGRWVVPVADKAGKLTPEELKRRASDLATAARIVQGVADECAGGRWATPEDVGMAVQKRTLEEQQSRLPSTQPATGPATVPTTAPVAPPQ